MNSTPRPSWVLSLYYGFLLFTTMVTQGMPYPLFGAVLLGPWATAVRALDCLLLIHVILGIHRAQRATWYLLLGYNAVNVLSLLVTLVVLSPAELGALLGGVDVDASFYTSIALALVAMLVATLYAVRVRDGFSNRSPYLF